MLNCPVHFTMFEHILMTGNFILIMIKPDENTDSE